MMIWAAKNYRMGGETEAEATFQDLFVKDGNGQGMLLVSERKGRRLRLFVGLPNEAKLHLFPGFEKISEAELPSRKKVSLLGGNQAEFENRFSRAVD